MIDSSFKFASTLYLPCGALFECASPLSVSPFSSRVSHVLLLPALLLLLLALSGSLFLAVGQQTATETAAMRRLDVAAEGAPRVIIEGTHVGNIYEVNRAVEVRGEVHGVMVFGGDVVVRGRVARDVAAIGGSVYQAENSYIGGDVIVIGGAYHHGKSAPGRNPATTTIMVAGFEEELRELARSPSSLLAPAPTLPYLGGRLLSVLFWFIVSLALSAVVPGTVSRAGARLRLTSVRIAAIGFASLLVILCGVPMSLSFLPAPLAAFVGILALLLVTLAYLFGRVVLHAVTGQFLQRLLLPPSANRQSASIALLLGALFWVFLLSLPFVWTIVAGGLLVVSLGLILTARSPMKWGRVTNTAPPHTP